MTMSKIGKSLMFYLRYFPEMQQAFEEERIFSGVDPAKVKAVGRAAGNEAFDLLTACTADWLNRLETSRVASFRCSKQKTVERNWGMEIDVRLPKQKASAPLRHQIGVLLGRDGLFPWVWSRGGVAIEERIFALLPAVKCFGSKAYGWSGGSVVINPIKIPWESAKDFSLDADPIINQAKLALEPIGPEFIERFIKL